MRIVLLPTEATLEGGSNLTDTHPILESETPGDTLETHDVMLETH